MTIRVVTPAAPELRLSNDKQVYVIGGSANADGARAYAERMAGVDPGTFANWFVVDLADTAIHSFAVDSKGAVGRAGSPWAVLTAGGDPLPAAA